MPAAGSSSSSSFGRAITARASSSLRCSPNARLAASSSRLCMRLENASTWSISARARREPPSQRTRKFSLLCAVEFCATHRFCQTVSWPKRRMFWKVRAMPSATRACGASAVISSSWYRTVPAVAGKRPHTTLTTVDLPEPFGPMRPKISPARTVRSMPSTALTPPKCLLSDLSSSTVSILAADEQPLCGGEHALIDEAVGRHIHGELDEPAKEMIAPVTEKAQALDQEALDEDDGEQRTEHAGEPTEDRIGDGEGGERHAELGVLDMRR